MASKTTYELEVRLGATTSASWKTSLKQAEQGLQGLNSLSNRIMAGIAAGVTAAAATATYAISNAKETYTGFEQEMATVQSISGATAQEFVDMKDAALEAGRSTIFTAEESASALEYMSLAGWDVEESVAGLMPVLRLAAATQKDLKTTSDLVTDSMSALGIEVDDLDMYLDKLIESNNDANTSAEQLMQALVKSGGASRTLGVSLDDTITSLEVLANNGKKGEKAGTALNSIFVRLAGNATALKELDKLKVDLWDDQGKFVGFEESLTRINEAMSQMTDEERAASLKNVAGTHYYSQMAYLLDAVKEVTDENGVTTTAWKELESQVADSSGALDRMYGITTDTLLNAEKRLQSAKEDMQIKITDVFSDDAKEFVGWLAEKLPEATDSIVDFAEEHKGEFADALENLGEGIEDLWDNGIAVGKWIVKNRGSITGALGGIASGIIAVKGAMTGIKIAEMLTNPLSAAMTAAGLAAVAIGGVAGAIKDAEREAKDANLAEHFGDIALSMEDIERAAEYIVSSDNLTGVATALEEFGKLDELSGTMEDAVSALEKMNWKVSIGMELTEEEQDEYKKAIEDFVNAANDYALQAKYSVSINMDLAFDEGDLGQSDITTKVNQFYEDKYQELTALGTDLNEAATDAFNDGLLEIDEINVISDLQTQMANIEKELAVGELEANLSVLQMDYSGKKLDAESFAKLQEELDAQVEAATSAYKEAYTKNYSAIAASHEGGYLTDSEYTAALQELKDNLASEIAEVEMKALQFQVNTINEGYSSEIWQYNQAVEDALEKYNEQTVDWENQPVIMWDAVMEEIRKNGPDKATKQAIAELLEAMSGSIDELYALKDDWGSLDEETQKQLTELFQSIETLQGITNYNKLFGSEGDVEGLTRDVANKVENSDEYGSIKGWVDQYYEDLVGYSKETATAALENTVETSKEETVKPIIEGMYAWSQETIDEYFSRGFNTEADLSVKLNTSLRGLPTLNGLSTYSLPDIKHNALGGIWNTPILTTFAEEGPEAAIPIDGSDRAKRLWAETGQLLGTLPQGNRDGEVLAGVSRADQKTGSGSSIQVSYNPVITVRGNASKEDITEALSLSLDDLRAMLAEIQREDMRVSFA